MRCRYISPNLPFLVPHLSPPPTGPSVLGIPLGRAKRWWDLVRIWQATAECSIAASGTDQIGSYEFATSTFTSTWTIDCMWTVPPPDGFESQLVGPYSSRAPLSRAILGGSSNYGTTIDCTLDYQGAPSPVGALQVLAQANVGCSIFDPFQLSDSFLPGGVVPVPGPRATYDPVGGLYYPRMLLGACMLVRGAGANPLLPAANADGLIQTDNIGSYLRNLDTYQYGASVAVQWEVVIDGITLPASIPGTAYFRRFDLYGQYLTPASILTATGSLTITPTTFWAYRGNDGIDLYDTATGEPAINPATGAPFTAAEIAAMPVP